MPRLQALLECVGQSLCEKGRKALQGQWSFADVMPEVVRSAFDATASFQKPMRFGLSDCGCRADEYERRIAELIAELATRTRPQGRNGDYLRARRRPPGPPPAVGPSGRTARVLNLQGRGVGVFLPPSTVSYRRQARGLDG